MKKKGAISATTTAESLPCPLCGIGNTSGADARRQLYACPRCGLVFRHPHNYPDAATEKAQYDLHENDPADPGYLAFLRRCTEPLVAVLQLHLVPAHRAAVRVEGGRIAAYALYENLWRAPQ